MVQLKEKNKDNSIPVSELKDGQIGIITEWASGDCIDEIVQRYKDGIAVIGGKNDERWCYVPVGTNCRVKVLEEGTELIITNNQ